jgi:hypothetical protein
MSSIETALDFLDLINKGDAHKLAELNADSGDARRSFVFVLDPIHRIRSVLGYWWRPCWIRNASVPDLIGVPKTTGAVECPRHRQEALGAREMDRAGAIYANVVFPLSTSSRATR